MKKLGWFLLLGLIPVTLNAEVADLLKGCEFDKPCQREMEGLTCADGTPAYYSVTLRKGAENLLFFLEGGGACWNPGTCSNPLFVNNLSRPKKFRSDWTDGDGLWNSRDKDNPFAENFNVVSLPYCTGDAHMGSRVTEYLIQGKKVPLRHYGHNNFKLVMESMAPLFADSKKVAMIGISSGGIGVTFNMRLLVQHFPKAAKYVINDAGTPFLPQFLSGDEYNKPIKNWGAVENLPSEKPVRHLGEVWDYNRTHFPDVKYAFVHSYGDIIMMVFARTLGALSPGNVIRDTLFEALRTHVGENNPTQKVFYLDNMEHARLYNPLEKQVSDGVHLKEWVREMIQDGRWENVTPKSSFY